MKSRIILNLLLLSGLIAFSPNHSNVFCTIREGATISRTENVVIFSGGTKDVDVPIDSFKFIQTVNNDEMIKYEADLSYITSEIYMPVEISFTYDSGEYRSSLKYVIIETNEFINVEDSSSPEVFEIVKSRASILNEFNKDIIERQQSILNSYLNKKKAITYSSNYDYVMQNYDYLLQLTSNDVLYSDFDFETSNGDDIFGFIPEELFKKIDPVYFVGKEFGFFLQTLTPQTPPFVNYSTGRLMLFDVEAIFPFGNNPYLGTNYFVVQNPIAYNFIYHSNASINKINFTSQNDKLFLRNIGFSVQLENNVELNIGDTDYSYNNDNGDYLQALRYYYDGRGPLVFEDGPSEEDYISFVADVFWFIAGFFDIFDVIGSIRDVLSLTEDFIGLVYDEYKSNEEENASRDDISYLEGAQVLLPTDHLIQKQEYGNMLRTGILSPDFSNEFSPLFGEGDFAKLQFTTNTSCTNETDSFETRLFLGFSCEVVQDSSTQQEVDIETVCQINSVIDFGTYQSRKTLLDLDNLMNVSRTKTLKPGETVRYIIKADDRHGRYEGTLSGENIHLKISRFTGTNSENYREVATMLNLNNNLTSSQNFSINLRYGSDYDYIAEIKNNDVDQQQTTLSINTPVNVNYNYNFENTPDADSTIYFAKDNSEELTRNLSHTFNINVSLSSSGVIHGLFNLYVDLYIKTFQTNNVYFFNSSNNLLLSTSLNSVFKEFDMLNSLSLDLNVNIISSTIMASTISGEFYILTGKEFGGVIVSPPITITEAGFTLEENV